MAEHRDEDGEYDEVYAETVLGYGGMLVRDGVGVEMPEEMALEFAIPEWRRAGAAPAQMAWLCVRALTMPGPGVRLLALEEIMSLSTSRLRVRDHAELVTSVRACLEHPDHRVQEMAQRALAELERTETDP